MRWFAILSMLACTAVSLAVQNAPPGRLAFEVASIRVNTTGADRRTFLVPPSGTLVFTNVTLRDLILRAYEIPVTMARFTVVGGRDTLLDTHFDVQAVPPDGTPREKLALMLQTLLTDRFNLKIHKEQRTIPAYAVTLVRERVLGPQLRPSTLDCTQLYGKENSPRLGADKRPWCAPSVAPGTWHLRGASPLDRALRNLQGFFDRPLLDRTELEGGFEWELEFPVYPNDPNREIAELSTALREQLGLRLQPVTAPFEVFVIDTLDMPTLN